MKGQDFFGREYPCLAAVNRCASTVPRHDGRLIWLTYEGEGTVKKTVYLVGKGIIYDTGGADIQAGGVMAGMPRDKCGAAATAGFIPLHPGADKLLMAAGGSGKPFWRMHAVHLNNKQDVDTQKASLKESDDHFANAPKRHPALLVNQAKPFNAETPLAIITDSFLTPSDLFFVRSHLPIPDIDPAAYELEVGGVGCEDLTLSLEDLKKLPKHTIVSALQCGGNRRLEMKTRKNSFDLPSVFTESLLLANILDWCWNME